MLAIIIFDAAKVQKLFHTEEKKHKKLPFTPLKPTKADQKQI